jgi:hypothetical protein
MTAPVFFITTHKIKPGQFGAFKALSDEYLAFVQANEPRAWAHYAYVDEDAMEVSMIQVHPDAASADQHMQIAHALIGRGLDLTETLTADVYGDPGPVVRQALAANAQNGTVVHVKPVELGGYHVAPTAH